MDVTLFVGLCSQPPFNRNSQPHLAARWIHVPSRHHHRQGYTRMQPPYGLGVKPTQKPFVSHHPLLGTCFVCEGATNSPNTGRGSSLSSLLERPRTTQHVLTSIRCSERQPLLPRRGVCRDGQEELSSCGRVVAASQRGEWCAVRN